MHKVQLSVVLGVKTRCILRIPPVPNKHLCPYLPFVQRLGKNYAARQYMSKNSLCSPEDVAERRGRDAHLGSRELRAQERTVLLRVHVLAQPLLHAPYKGKLFNSKGQLGYIFSHLDPP